MWKNKTIWFSIMLAFVVSMRSAGAQGGAASGLYQITSGAYIECCGLAGEIHSSLPNGGQSFVKLAVDPQTEMATMTFLGKDMQTVFSVIPCSPRDPPIHFSFDHGLVFSNRLVFHVDPGGPPYHKYWNYTVSNSANHLRIEGVLGTLQPSCADVPERFSHGNVVAVLMSPPKLSITGVSSNGATLFLQGHAGRTNVIEASTNLVTWVGVSTNVMDYSLCPICPFAIFEDSESTNLSRRFYRAFEYP